MDHDDNHSLAVEAVAEAKGHPLKDDSEETAAGPRAELLRKVSAEDELFTKATARRREY